MARVQEKLSSEFSTSVRLRLWDAKQTLISIGLLDARSNIQLSSFVQVLAYASEVGIIGKSFKDIKKACLGLIKKIAEKGELYIPGNKKKSSACEITSVILDSPDSRGARWFLEILQLQKK